MFHRCLFIVFSVLAVGGRSTAAGPKVAERWAVLIGVDDYANANDLQFCGADQTSLRERLIISGFRPENVTLLHDKATENKYRPMQRNIEDQLRLTIGNAESDDLLVVAFSGHGVSLAGKSYLCPSDARLNDPATLISLDNVYEQLRQCSARFKWVLVDACRNDPTLGGGRSFTATEGTKQLARSLQQIKLPEGVVLMNSCAPDEISWEEQTFGHGVYMHYVLEAMAGAGDADQDKFISLNELQRYASGRTRSYVSGKFNQLQRPFYRSEGEAEAMDFALLPVSLNLGRLTVAIPKSTGSQNRVISGRGFSDIPVGCTQNVVLGIMGEPDSKKMYANGLYFNYDSISFVFDKATQNLILIFIEKSFNAVTDKGTRFGDTPSKVIELYGAPARAYDSAAGGLLQSFERAGQIRDGWLEYTQDGISFDIRGGVVDGFNIIGGLTTTADVTPELTNSIGMKLTRISAGEFLMGSSDSDADAEPDEKPQHRVRITKPFYLGQTEVTQGQWRTVMGTAPWNGQKNVKEESQCVATFVSWNDAKEFCRKLGAMEGKTYELPTEAQWEYASRAQTTTKYSFGDDESRIRDYVWSLTKDPQEMVLTHAETVAQKRPNAWGLYDLSGNAYEWCDDRYATDYYGMSPAEDPTGATAGSYRVLRGGSWSSFPRDCRAANRFRGDPDQKAAYLGFRVVLVP